MEIVLALHVVGLFYAVLAIMLQRIPIYEIVGLRLHIIALYAETLAMILTFIE
jgi:hypothetical protein